MVAGDVGPAVHQTPGPPGQATALQVHKGEGDIGHDVGVAQRGIEFERVERQRLAAKHDDVAQVQIAMAFAHPALCMTGSKAEREVGQGLLGPATQGRQPADVRRGGGAAGQRLEVVQRPGADGLWPAPFGGRRRQPGVKAPDLPRQRVDERGVQAAGVGLLVELL